MATHPDNPSQARSNVVQVRTPFGLCTELPLQTFLDHALPPLHDGLDPGSILKSLRIGQKSQNLVTKHNRWRGFAKDPKDSDKSVYHTFRHLEAIVNSIIKASNSTFRGTEHTVRFESNPASVAKFRYSSDKRFPDASFVEGSEPGWERIAVCGEYDTDELPGYVEDSTTRVANSMANCMSHDLRRRFIFGFTIKNTEMRFWFCDRSRFLTSRPFNFITDHLPWIRFCLSILYAKPDQLGWDTGMIPSPDGRNFDIPVRSADGQTRTYRTQSFLSSVGSRNRLGKGTKVWKAVRVKDGEEIGPPVVLKDCWVYPDYIREGDAIRCIRLDALASQDEELIAQMVPDIEWHGDVFIGGDEPALDCTRTFGTDEPIQDRASKPSVYQLVHYRLVLIPVMEKSIEHEMSIPTIFHALAQVAGALRLMHKAGWVHRDVSTGNVLLGTPPRLVDFEYAKRASDEEDLALGTRFFKAFEVDTQSYVYMPPPELTPLPTMTLEELGRIGRAYFTKEFQEQKAARAEAESKGTRTEATEKTPEIEGESQPVETEPSPQPAEPQTPPPEIIPPTIVPLRYNPLHDLESLWWIAVYFVLQRELHKSAPDPLVDERASSWDREEQRRWANGVFHSNDFRCPIMFAPGSGYFHTNVRSIVHPAMRPVVSILEDLRQDLVRRYTELEKDPASIDFTCADGLHEHFIARLSNIANLGHLKDVSLVPLAAPPSLIPPATVPPAPQVIPHQDAKSQITKETKKSTRSKKQRKPTVITPAHCYNLRPRTKRS